MRYFPIDLDGCVAYCYLYQLPCETFSFLESSLFYPSAVDSSATKWKTDGLSVLIVLPSLIIGANRTWQLWCSEYLFWANFKILSFFSCRPVACGNSSNDSYNREAMSSLDANDGRLSRTIAGLEAVLRSFRMNSDILIDLCKYMLYVYERANRCVSQSVYCSES